MNNNVLEHKFVYQNSTTGKVSSTPLTTRQLVQLLCPIHHHSSTAAAAIMTPDTLVLGISDTYEYDKSGWKPCKHVPVLKEACASWYYLEHHQQEQEGPVSCRQLHDLLSNQTITKNTTLVWSSHLLTEWKSISDLPDLCAALEAFETKLVAAPFAAAPMTMRKFKKNCKHSCRRRHTWDHNTSIQTIMMMNKDMSVTVEPPTSRMFPSQEIGFLQSWSKRIIMIMAPNRNDHFNNNNNNNRKLPPRRRRNNVRRD